MSATAPMPLVSVLMPVRDGRPFLASAVRSILRQTFSDFELVVVDDGSQDGSTRVLDRFAQVDRRVRIVHQPPLGLVAALNNGLELARGALIARMDADDVAYSDRLGRQVAFMQQQPHVGILGTATVTIDTRGRQFRTVLYPRQDARIRHTLKRRMAFCHPTIMVRTKLLQEVGGYRPAFAAAEDYDLFLRLAEHTQLANLPDCLLAYRAHRRQVSANAIEQQVLCAVGARHAASARRDARPDPFDLGPITLDRLVQMGYPRPTLLNDIVHDLATRAVHFVTIRDEETAERLLVEASTWADGVELRGDVRARLSAARAAVLFSKRRLAPAAAALADAVKANPSSVAGFTWRRLRIAAEQLLTV